jgi:hypothetical protein
LRVKAGFEQRKRGSEGGIAQITDLDEMLLFGQFGGIALQHQPATAHYVCPVGNLECQTDVLLY